MATAGTPTPLRPGRRYRIDAGAELPTVHGPVRIPATTMALLVALEPSRPTVHVDLAIEGAAKRVEIDAEAFQREATLLVGKPFCAAFGDPPRAGFGGLTVPGGSAAPVGVGSPLQSVVEALQDDVKAHAEAIESQGERLDAQLTMIDNLRGRMKAAEARGLTVQYEGGHPQAAPAGRDEKIAALQAALTAALGPGSLDEPKVRELARDEAASVVGSALGSFRPDLLAETAAQVAPVAGEVQAVSERLATLEAAIGSATPSTRARVEIAAAASDNPILAALLRYYRVGTEAPANVVLAAPPSLGKTYAVRVLGKAYDLFLEHGCTDDIDETATLLGSPVPDGAGGFLTVDGVLTQAVRAAASGQNVLLLLDEVFRLGERQQEFLLSFLTGVKTGAGRVYRLRTRRVVVDATTGESSLEVIEAPVERLHIVGATNLGRRKPVQAFWSRWQVVRFDWDATVVQSTAAAIIRSFGFPEVEVAKLAPRFTQACVAARKFLIAGKFDYPVDLRTLERACQLAPRPTAEDVCAWISGTVQDQCAGWSLDTGEVSPASTDAVAEVVSILALAF